MMYVFKIQEMKSINNSPSFNIKIVFGSNIAIWTVFNVGSGWLSNECLLEGSYMLWQLDRYVYSTFMFYCYKCVTWQPLSLPSFC